MVNRMQHVTELIRDKRVLLENLSRVLLEREVLEADEFKRLVEEWKQQNTAAA